MEREDIDIPTYDCVTGCDPETAANFGQMQEMTGGCGNFVETAEYLAAVTLLEEAWSLLDEMRSALKGAEYALGLFEAGWLAKAREFMEGDDESRKMEGEWRGRGR